MFGQKDLLEQSKKSLIFLLDLTHFNCIYINKTLVTLKSFYFQNVYKFWIKTMNHLLNIVESQENFWIWHLTVQG